MKETKIIRMKKMKKQQPDSWQAQLRRDALGPRYVPIPDERETIDYLLHTYMKEEHRVVVQLLYQKGLTPKQAGSQGEKHGSSYYKQRLRYILQRLVSRSLYAYTRYGLKQTRQCLDILRKEDASLPTIFRLPAAMLFASPDHDGSISKAEAHLEEDTIGDIYLRCSRTTYLARTSGDQDLTEQAMALYSLLSPCMETLWSNGLFLENVSLQESYLYRKADLEKKVLDKVLSLRYLSATSLLPADELRRLHFCCAKAHVGMHALQDSIYLAHRCPQPESIQYDLIHEFAAQLLTGSPIMELLFYNPKTYMTDELIVRHIELENAEYRMGERDRLTTVDIHLQTPLYAALMEEADGNQSLLRSIVWKSLAQDIQAHSKRSYLDHEDTEVNEVIQVRLPSSLVNDAAELLNGDFEQEMRRALWYWYDNDQYMKQVKNLPF